MRLAGSIQIEPHARRFADHLRHLSIDVKLEPDAGRWQIWVLDEAQLERACDELDAFRAEPEAQRYLASAAIGRNLREKSAKENDHPAATVRSIDDRVLGAHPATYLIAALAIAVALATNLGAEHDSISRYLHIVDYSVEGKYISFDRRFLHDVRAGEVWRLVTPILLHFGLPHLVFNLMWLLDLGGQVEQHKGATRYVLLVLLIAIPSNVAELVVSGPQFGGLSGVIYGLFGYILARSRFDPACPMSLRPSTVMWMLGWFAFCFTGVLPVANTVHAVGLAVGCLVGARHEIRHRLFDR